ncbi:hypothetical protein HIM_11292 [Hirsutella minnesotensis 3608]|uniref:Uncharacterized protein n=1 Tax=Hirsutella minnesotensis 3608 TaxID=1043627 RepID=A0A0F8A1D6_9HYPO|nr:hypothetical protein HIM_11292 [Hirsutella minnesotensis 3608]
MAATSLKALLIGINYFGQRLLKSRPSTAAIPSRHDQLRAALFAMETPRSQQSEYPTMTRATDRVDALSIHQRARRYPRSRIIAEPLLWTKLHLELLQCTFAGPCSAPLVIMELDNPDRERIQRGFDASFKGSWSRDRERAMRCILSAFNSPLESFTNLNFFLGGYRNILLPCLTFFIRSEPNYDFGPLPPVAAYIDHRQVVDLRERRILKQYVGRRRHQPGLTLARLECNRFTTNELLHEPYVVALVIALAEAQWWFVGPERRKQASGAKPKVFFTTDDNESIYLYSARVSSAFIAMLYDPHVPPTTPQPLHIQITQPRIQKTWAQRPIWLYIDNYITDDASRPSKAQSIRNPSQGPRSSQRGGEPKASCLVNPVKSANHHLMLESTVSTLCKPPPNAAADYDATRDGPLSFNIAPRRSKKKYSRQQ